MFNVRGPRSIATGLHQRTGTIGFNIICNVDSCNLSRGLGVAQGTTRRFVSHCFSGCPNIGRFVRSVIGRTGRANCIRALFREHHCLPSVRGHGFGLHSFTRHATVGSPVRNATTSVVGITVIQVSGILGRGKLRTGVLLRIRSRLVFRYPRRRVPILRGLIPRVVRRTISLTIPLGISDGSKSD